MYLTNALDVAPRCGDFALRFNCGWRITVSKLASLLKPFQIEPRKIRFDPKPLQGYKASDFDDTFSRYLPIDPEHRNNPQKTGKNQHIDPEQPTESVPDETDRKPAENQRCSGVPDEIPGDLEGWVSDL